MRKLNATIPAVISADPIMARSLSITALRTAIVPQTLAKKRLVAISIVAYRDILAFVPANVICIRVVSQAAAKRGAI